MDQHMRRLVGFVVMLGVVVAGLQPIAWAAADPAPASVGPRGTFTKRIARPLSNTSAKQPQPAAVKPAPTVGNQPAAPIGSGSPTPMASMTCQPMVYGDVDSTGIVDVDDLVCVNEGFQGYHGCAPFAFQDMAPCGGNGVLDLDDLTAAQEAFQGHPRCQNVCKPCVNNQLPQQVNAGPARTGTSGRPVSFSGSAVDADGQIVAYAWEFGDGQTDTGANVTHAYASAGAYTARLTVTDSCNGTASAQSSVTISDGNQAPVAGAGPDQTVTLPGIGLCVVANLDGTVTDDGLPSGSTVTTLWSKVSGPGSVSFGNTHAIDTTARFCVAGSYVLRLTASDGLLGGTDEMMIIVNPVPTYTLTLTVTPQDGGAIGRSPAGPNYPVGTVVQLIANAAATYHFDRWSGALSGSTTPATITMDGNKSVGAIFARNNQAPTVSAGADQSVNLPSGASLDGTVSDDGLPSGTLTTLWTKVSGPGTVTFDNAAAVDTTAHFSVEGSYGLRLSANDGALGTTDDLLVMVIKANPCAGNQPPIAVITAPASGHELEDLLFDGTHSSDPENLPLNGYQWQFGDGAGTTMQPEARVTHQYTQPGTYTVKLWVQDACAAVSTPAQATIAITSTVTFNPRLQGFVQGMIGTAQGVSISPDGQKLYVASQELGVVEFDVATDPRNPRFLRTAHIFEPAQGVVAGNSMLLTGGANNGAKLIPLSTFATPQEERVPLGFVAQGMALCGNSAYLAALQSGFKVFRLNLADADLPQVAATFSLPMFAHGVAVSANCSRAFVAAGQGPSGGLKVVDLSAPVPIVIGSLAPPADANSSDVALSQSETTAYVADYGTGVSVVDVSNPILPRKLTSLTTSGPANRVTRMGNLLLVATVGGTARLHVFNVANATNPIEVGSLSGELYELDGRNNYAYAAMGTAGVAVIDLTNPAQPQVVNTIRSSIGSRTACASDGRIALVGGSQMATTVLDVTNPQAPVPTAQIASTAQDICLFDHGASGRRAYLAAGPDGLRVVDVTDPHNPNIIATVTTANLFAKGVALLSRDNGLWALVAAGTVGGAGRVAVVDLSNPAAPPTVVANVTMSTGGNSSDIALSDDNRYAYVADYGGGLQVLDVTDPLHPVRVGNGLLVGNTAARVAVMGDYVLVSTLSQQNAHLSIIDASDPASLHEVGSIPGLFEGALDSYSHYALLPSISLGLLITDLADPAHPVTSVAVKVPGAASSAIRSGNRVYLGDSATVLDVVDLFAP